LLRFSNNPRRREPTACQNNAKDPNLLGTAKDAKNRKESRLAIAMTLLANGLWNDTDKSEKGIEMNAAKNDPNPKRRNCDEGADERNPSQM